MGCDIVKGLESERRLPLGSADSDPQGSPAGQATADQGEAVLVRAVAAYRAALGSRLIAGYALGSLAHGGFSPR